MDASLVLAVKDAGTLGAPLVLARKLEVGGVQSKGG